jgi:hypothetical protein
MVVVAGRGFEYRDGFAGRDGIVEQLKRPFRSALPAWLVLSLLYRRAHGRFPKLFEPTTFTDKVLWRAAFDRRPILAQISDKARARDYVIAALGAQAVPKLYFSTTRPATIPFDGLPDRFVVKPTHASGWVALVRERAVLDQDALIRLCDRWLRQSYYALSHEWVYKHAAPRIHVEEFVQDEHPGAPLDYKLFVFGGAVAMIQVDAGRFTKLRRALYTRDWQRLDARMMVDPIPDPVARPPRLEEMIVAAERLAKGFDFLRVDCLTSSASFYVNELSATPGRGLCPFEPIAFDRQLGARWKLPGRTAT